MATHTVLIVEDEALFADTLALTLQKAGFSTVVAASAQSAIDAVDEHKVDVIVLDIFLPEGNGIQLLHELRSHHDTAETPVIICTSAYSSVPKDALQRYGVVDVLDKVSVTSADLRAYVKASLPS